MEGAVQRHPRAQYALQQINIALDRIVSAHGGRKAAVGQNIIREGANIAGSCWHVQRLHIVACISKLLCDGYR
jgi:hypothetical protein